MPVLPKGNARNRHGGHCAAPVAGSRETSLQDLRRFAADDDDIGAAPGEQANTYDAGYLVDRGFKSNRVDNRQPMYVENHVAVVSHDAGAFSHLPPHGLTTRAGKNLAGHKTAGHRNDLYRQWKFPQHVDPFGGVDDADELSAGLGDYLLAGQCGAAALYQAFVRI